MGLDRDKNQIDGIGSNMGHCLWTGIVDEEKAARGRARAHRSDGMFSGWGVRTLSESMRGYNPISYHCGSVWPHDNAICAAGLMRYGFVDEAHQVMLGLVEASRVVRQPAARAVRGHAARRCRLPGAATRPRAHRRRGPRRRRCCSCARCCASSPTSGTRSCTSRPRSPSGSAACGSNSIPVMGGHLTIDVEGEIVHTLEVPEGLELVVEPREATQ